MFTNISNTIKSEEFQRGAIKVAGSVVGMIASIAAAQVISAVVEKTTDAIANKLFESKVEVTTVE